MGEMNELNQWYEKQCDGDWEHQYGIKIESLDNPGWLLKVDLVDTELEGERHDAGTGMDTDDAWLGVTSDGRVFTAACAPALLRRAIREFLDFARRSSGS